MVPITPKRSDQGVDRQRHFRALTYTMVSLALAAIGYLFLGFDKGQTLAYGIASYVLLNVLNYRYMFIRQRSEAGEPPPDSRSRQ